MRERMWMLTISDCILSIPERYPKHTAPQDYMRPLGLQAGRRGVVYRGACQGHTSRSDEVTSVYDY